MERAVWGHVSHKSTQYSTPRALKSGCYRAAYPMTKMLSGHPVTNILAFILRIS